MSKCGSGQSNQVEFSLDNMYTPTVVRTYKLPKNLSTPVTPPSFAAVSHVSLHYM